MYHERGHSGRVPDSRMESYDKYARLNITLPQDLNARLSKYCDEDERTKSWCFQKALDEWLKKRGY